MARFCCPRLTRLKIHGKERASKGNYQEVELGFTNKKAVKEAETVPALLPNGNGSRIK